jgi:hypothetical protein
VALTRRALLTGAAAAAVTGPILWTPPAASAVAIQGVHLGFGDEARRRMTVSWSTPVSVRRPTLDLGLDGRYGRVVPTESRPAPGVGTVYHHAHVDDLRPGGTYHYRIRHDGGAEVTGVLRAAPAGPARFRFATFGDMGVSDAAARNVRLLTLADPAFCFVVGDLCYADPSGGTSSAAPSQAYRPEVWDRWLAQIAPSASRIPWMATVGNHEMERGAGELGYDGYLARFALPGNGVPGSPTYSFRYGSVGFVALDGNDASYEIDRNRGYLGRVQDEWLERSLRALRADPAVEFVVVGFHNCMYCSNVVHGSDGGNRSRWQALFERHRVDLVVNGHNHCYERTHPVGGVTYLTVGGAGQAVYPASTHPVSYVTEAGGARVPESAAWSAVRILEHSVALVDVTPGRMIVQALDLEGTVVDRVGLTAR